MKLHLTILKNRNTIDSILTVMWLITAIVLFCIIAGYLHNITGIVTL